MIDEITVYKYYLLTKVHFTKKGFDVFKEKGIRFSYESFLSRQDNKLFGKLGGKFETEQELIRYLVANISAGHNPLVEYETGEVNFKRWEKYKSSVTYHFQADMSAIEMFMYKNNVSFEMASWNCYLGGNINILSVCMLHQMDGILDRLDASLLLLNKEEIFRVKKCEGFISPNDKVKSIFKSFKESIKGNGKI